MSKLMPEYDRLKKASQRRGLPICQKLKSPQGIEHGPGLWHLMRAEKIRFSQCGEHGKEGLGAADFLSEILESVGESVADREAERSQPKCSQEGFHLVLNTRGAVLKVAVVKAHAGIDEDFLEARFGRHLDFSGEIFVEHGDEISFENQVAHLAHIWTLDKTDDD